MQERPEKKTQRYLYNTDLLSTPVGGNESEDVIRTLEHVIPDSKYLDELDINLELQDILSNIDNNESNRIVIKYGNGDNECIFKFSYKNADYRGSKVSFVFKRHYGGLDKNRGKK